jgi:hypothetical protein
MKKYFSYAIIVELICIAYTIIHNYLYLSQYIMFGAAILMVAASIFLYWQCFSDKTLTKQQKTIGLIVASIPVVVVISWLVFIAFVLFFGVH